MERAILKEDAQVKLLRSKTYNYNFDKATGFFERWGERKEDNPECSPFGPEIWDCEITTSCSGPSGTPCAFCYKSNTPAGINLSFENFKIMIDKFPKTLTQVAFGADATLKSNLDLWKMMEYSKSIGIIPNITVANIANETAANLAKYCGAVAVSRYADKNICYDSVAKLTSLGMSQVNIHQMISDETYEQALETADDASTDPRLKGLNAIVFLGLKPKGRARGRFNLLPYEKFDFLFQKCINKNIGFGFDSCSAGKFIRSVDGMSAGEGVKTALKEMAEPCEAYLFSFYTNAEGFTFPCSFTEDEGKWKEGINMLEIKDFMKDIWGSPKVKEWQEVMKVKRECLTFPEIN